VGAPNLNMVCLVGQLTGDPELRELPDGRSVCDLRPRSRPARAAAAVGAGAVGAQGLA
jgi:single-stranded DNA-binding protein